MKTCPDTYKEPICKELESFLFLYVYFLKVFKEISVESLADHEANGTEISVATQQRIIDLTKIFQKS